MLYNKPIFSLYKHPKIVHGPCFLYGPSIASHYAKVRIEVYCIQRDFQQCRKPEIMIHNIQSDFVVDPGKEVLNVDNTAELLKISTATVRNWIKCGHLPAHNKNNKYFFYRADVENLRSKLLNGELEKLHKRANKIKARRTFLPEEHIKIQTHLDKFNSIINFIQKNNIETEIALFLLSLNFLKKRRYY